MNPLKIFSPLLCVLLSVNLIYAKPGSGNSCHSEKEHKQIYHQIQDNLEKHNFSVVLQILKDHPGLYSYPDQMAYVQGICLWETGKKDKAFPLIVSAFENGTFETDEIKLYYAKALRFASEYGGAFTYFMDLNNSNIISKVELIHVVNSCRFGMELISEKSEYTISNVGYGINTESDDFCLIPGINDNNFFFSSSYLKEIGKYSSRKKKAENAYSIEKDLMGWQQKELIGKPFSLSPNNSVLYFDRKHYVAYYYNDLWGGDIYYTRKAGNSWVKGKPVKGGINTENRETSACLSADGKTMIFTSDRPGSLGGLDLYISRLGDDKLWTKPQNLGKVVNTSFNEESPWLSRDGKTLYFSSKGHKGLGGYDVFVSHLLENGNWSDPQNMGIPVNSSENDIYFVPGSEGDCFFLSSDRKGSFGGLDIWIGKKTVSDFEYSQK